MTQTFNLLWVADLNGVKLTSSEHRQSSVCVRHDENVNLSYRWRSRKVARPWLQGYPRPTFPLHKAQRSRANGVQAEGVMVKIGRVREQVFWYDRAIFAVAENLAGGRRPGLFQSHHNSVRIWRYDSLDMRVRRAIGRIDSGVHNLCEGE